MEKQCTLAGEISYAGIGLHSGREVCMTLRPAGPDTGLVFVRSDLPQRPQIRAVAANVTSTLRATMIEENGVRVFTVEHLLSALFAADIDNCIIEMDAEEPPVGDGSALVFLDLLAQAGRTEQTAAREIVAIDRVFRVDDGDRFVIAVPYDGLRVTFTSLNPHPLVGMQYADFVLNEGDYRREIAPARTIACEQEIEALQKMGLGLGGTLENVIVYNDERWLNPLRYPDELVRHKVLDAIGDLRLAGAVRGHIIAVKSAHALNTLLARRIYDAYRAPKAKGDKSFVKK